MGYLNQFFQAVAVKRLSEVEVDAAKSNQHEFNATTDILRILGKENSSKLYKTRFVYADDDSEYIAVDGTITLYNARVNNPTRNEWRLYYNSNEVTNMASVGDILILCLVNDEELCAIFAKANDNIESQILWLLDIESLDGKFVVKELSESLPSEELLFVANGILESLGFEPPTTPACDEEELVSKFGYAFPSTSVFSAFAREKAGTVDATGDPDATLLKWLSVENDLFRSLEKAIIREAIENGWGHGSELDVDAFIKFSLSVQNRRKSRAGRSLESHLCELFNLHHLTYTSNGVTENKSKPDFIFPSIELYHFPEFPEELLTMLGAKTTAKERWRQVLDEAERISHKHLITIQGAISENQTNAMRNRKLQLVVPKAIHESYTDKQQKWLFSVADFISVVMDRQEKSLAR